LIYYCGVVIGYWKSENALKAKAREAEVEKLMMMMVVVVLNEKW
jgi:hypothetical protein